MYSKAIVRKPGQNYIQGITTSNLGRPVIDKVLEQHQAYCNALIECDIELIVLEADENFPDGCFVEDTAVITKEVAIITRPGVESRRGEEVGISEILSVFRKIAKIHSPGAVDGGDIMRMNDHFFIGLSGRTNKEGARQLAFILSEYGYTSSEVPVETVPHLKSGITYTGKDYFISIEEFAAKFRKYEVVRVGKEESYSSNVLNVNGSLLIAAGYPETRIRLEGLGFKIISLEMSEFRKMDGALTCLSLLF